MERVSLWRQLCEPCTTKDLFLICVCMVLGFAVGMVTATGIILS